jgi:hypothetical protein
MILFHVIFILGLNNPKIHIMIMDEAAGNGHIDIVKFLHSIGKICTVTAMDQAAGNVHIEIVKFLHSIDKDWTRQLETDTLIL